MEGVAEAVVEAPKVGQVMMGTAAEKAIPAAISRIGCHKAFLMVSSTLLKETPIVKDLQKALGAQCVGCFDGMPPHTPREVVVEVAARVRASGADVIVTIGGGSLTDAAKGVQIALAYNATDVESLGALRLGQPRSQASVSELPVQYIAVPTTLSGGEFSPFAGITDIKRQVKEPYGHKLCAPRVVILDPHLALHTPSWLWSSTGMRAVDHAVEGLCSTKSNPYSSGLARIGLEMLARGLKECHKDPHNPAPRQLCQLGMWQATEAARIAGAGASHAIGHTLGGTCDVPHGYTSCVMLPAVLHWNQSRGSPPGLALVSTALGKPEATPAAEAVRELVQSLEMPLTLADVGVGKHQFEQIAKITMDDNALKTNPCPIRNPSEIVEILHLANGGAFANRPPAVSRAGVIDTPNGDPKTWQVGGCTVTRIIEMETVGGQEWILPTASKEITKSVPWLCPSFADEKGRMKFAIQLLVVDAPGARIAIDTCVGNDKIRPLPNWHMRTAPFLNHMRAAGIPPESVTHVFCTHLHTDHIGWNTMKVNGKWVPTFPNAQYLFGKKEYDYWSGGGRAGEGEAIEGGIDEEMADSVQPIVDQGLARFVETDHVIVNCEDAIVYLRSTAGHTPGHASLMIDSRGTKAIVTGDCFHHPIQFTKPEVYSRADTDRKQARRTREELMTEFCGTETMVFGTHFARPTVGTVKRHSENYKLDTAAADARVVNDARLGAKL